MTPPEYSRYGPELTLSEWPQRRLTSRIMTLSDIKSAIQEYVYLSDTNLIDVVLGCAAANQINTDPVSMYVIGPPSSAKTEILRTLEGYHRTYHPSKITPQTFLSGYIRHPSRKKKDDDKKEPEKSLLVRLTSEGKNILIVKDVTTIICMRQEYRSEILSQIREIADGRITANFGSGEEVVWRGKMAVMGAVTPAIDELGSINQTLGERFISFRTKIEDPLEVLKKVESVTGKIDMYREKTQELVREFMLGVELGIELAPIDPEVAGKLRNLAAFVVQARTGVSRDFRTGIINTPPIVEGPARLYRQLQVLGSGIAAVRGVDTVDLEVYKLLKKVARDTIPPWRVQLLSSIYSKPGEYSTKNICKSWGMPLTTGRRHLEDLGLTALKKLLPRSYTSLQLLGS